MAPDDHFLTTRWTQVLTAKGASTQAGTALADLCAAYYSPVHAYISRTARDLGDPRDLTQGFFARLLAGGTLDGADRGKGRFRAYLLGAVQHFLADARASFRASRRGSQHEHVPFDHGADSVPAGAQTGEPPEAFFDREWGIALLERALSALASEHERLGQAAHFEVLKPWLTGDVGTLTQAAAAARLGMSEGAVKVAIHRLRKRFRVLVKAEIAETVSTEEEAREELRYLIQVVLEDR